MEIKSPYATSTIASPPLDNNNQVQGSNQINEDKLNYVPHSPYYEPVHPLQFMRMSELIINKLMRKMLNL